MTSTVSRTASLGIFVRATIRATANALRPSTVWTLLALSLFVALPLAIWRLLPPVRLPAFEPSLLGITIAVAVFSINMSLTVPKSSTYKDIHSDTPPRHIALIFVFLLAATAPICTAVYFPQNVTKVSLTTLIVLAYGSVALLALAKHESSAATLVHRYSSKWGITSDLETIARMARDRLLLEKSKPLVDNGNRPMHEIGFAGGPMHLNGPIQRLEDITQIAASAGDTDTYCAALSGLVRVAAIAGDYKLPERFADGSSYQIQEMMRQYAYSPLLRIARHVTTIDKTGRLSSLSISVLSDSVSIPLREGKGLPPHARCFLWVSWEYASHLLDLRLAGNALAHLVALREAVECEAARVGSDALADPPSPDNLSAGVQAPTGVTPPPADASRLADVATAEDTRPDPNEDLSLATLIGLVKEAGQKAIVIGNADLLYRCLDVLSYTGCTAIRRRLYFLGKECARGLCQLGRLARHNGLECHWDKCALSPFDHALERLGFMLTWVIGLAPADRHRWLRLFDEIYSRLYGYSAKIEINEASQQPQTTVNVDSKSPHRISFSSNAGSRTLDFSDHSMLKDMDWL